MDSTNKIIIKRNTHEVNTTQYAIVKHKRNKYETHQHDIKSSVSGMTVIYYCSRCDVTWTARTINTPRCKNPIISKQESIEVYYHWTNDIKNATKIDATDWQQHLTRLLSTERNKPGYKRFNFYDIKHQ